MPEVQPKAAHPAARVQAQWWQCCVQVVTGESGSDEDRQRDALLRRVTELRGSISCAQDRYGAVMDALSATEDMAALTQQVRLLQAFQRSAAFPDIRAAVLEHAHSSYQTTN